MSGKNIIYEHLWDCSNCGTEDISALRKQKCPNCGHSKTSQDVEKRTRIEVKDAEGLALAHGGENWVCSHCGSVNLKKHTDCQSCSNSKDKSDHVNEVRKMATPPPPVYSAKDEDKQFYEPEIVAEKEKPKKPNRTPPVNAKRTSQSIIATTEEISGTDPTLIKNGILVFFGVVFVVVLLGLLAYIIFHTKSVDGLAKSFSWSRDVVIEEYRTVHYTDKSSTPVGAYNVTSRQETRLVPKYRTEQKPVDCSYTTEGSCTDLGNGSESCSPDVYHQKTCYDPVQVFDHNEPVIDTYYSYDLDEWTYEWTAHAEGNDRNPYWPEYTLYLEGQQILGAERISGTPESYVVYFETNEKDEIKIYNLTTSESEWNQYVQGDLYPLEINTLSMIMNNPLQDKINITLTSQPE